MWTRTAAIPRTLAMALEDLAISHHRTSQRRLAIKTFVSPLSEGLIRSRARELSAGGKVYSAHEIVPRTWARWRGCCGSAQRTANGNA